MEFRSRAEARWAIFFDLMGWDWDYEPAHYHLADRQDSCAAGALTYLPDFYLPLTRTWVEVKGPTYLDAASMGKIASSVAGPFPLPARTPPYGQADAFMLVGPFGSYQPGLRPVHQCVIAASPAVAGMVRAVWCRDGLVTALDAKAWICVPATGAKTSRRPTAERAAKILAPPPVPDPEWDPALAHAYATAGAVKFDDATGAAKVAHIDALRLRRAGRPLSCAA